MMKNIFVGTALLSGACGPSTSYTIGGQTLTVKDSAYVAATFICQAGLSAQLEVVIVDYTPVCNGTPLGADAGSTTLEHNEIDLLFQTSLHTDRSMPYVVGRTDCANGPVSAGTATFRHFPSSGAAPTVTQAVSGELYLTATDPKATGRFTLDFGAQGSIAGSFDAAACN